VYFSRLSLSNRDSQDTFRIQSPTYVDPRPAQGLETPPRTFTSHLPSDPKCRPPSAQPRTQLSMATCPGQRTMEAIRGNGYAPAWGSLVMMMMGAGQIVSQCHKLDFLLCALCHI